MNEAIVSRQAKKIMDDFITALDTIDDTDLTVGVVRENAIREDSEDSKDKDFIDLFLKNTSQGTSNGFVKLEKKKW